MSGTRLQLKAASSKAVCFLARPTNLAAALVSNLDELGIEAPMVIELCRQAPSGLIRLAWCLSLGVEERSSPSHEIFISYYLSSPLSLTIKTDRNTLFCDCIKHCDFYSRFHSFSAFFTSHSFSGQSFHQTTRLSKYQTKPPLHHRKRKTHQSYLISIHKMQLSTLLTALALAASSVSATYNASTVYTTEVLTAYTTYCPAATSIVHGTQTYIVTEVKKYRNLPPESRALSSSPTSTANTKNKNRPQP